jgi:hypothetical protein
MTRTSRSWVHRFNDRREFLGVGMTDLQKEYLDLLRAQQSMHERQAGAR